MLSSFSSLFHFDWIATILILLVLFIGICVAIFASRYMKGDTRYRLFFLYLALLITAIGILVCADHMLLLFLGWCTSNFLLLKLMIHKPIWQAAKRSGQLAGKNDLIGASCVGLALIILYLATGETSIQVIIHKHLPPFLTVPTFLLLLIGAMTQSAIWPFHRWLISSLNSPTPVSAIMHAGLVNGGGFLLIRFAPLYLEQPYLLTTIFLIGIASALMGTFWKLMQNDVKRMLACSTMGQMGFMMAQCGLGLFPAAIAHLVTHGLFKAYLFLSSGDAVQDKRHDLGDRPSAFTFSVSLICGALGSYCFGLASGKSWLAKDTTLVLMVIAFLAASQAALPILSLKIRFKIPIALFVTSAISLFYGANMSLIANFMEPMNLMKPQALNLFHILGIALLILSWLSIFFVKNNVKIQCLQKWKIRGYVSGLNASQPDPKTITTYRNQYKY